MSQNPDSLTEEQRKTLSGPALIGFLEASSDWKLTNKEELSFAGYPNPTEFQAWCMAAIEDEPFCLEENLLLRVGAISGVHKAISKLIPTKADRLHWLMNPVRGPVCRGLSPFEIMSEPDHLRVVQFRQQLDLWLALPWIGKAKVKHLS